MGQLKKHKAYDVILSSVPTGTSVMSNDSNVQTLSQTITNHRGTTFDTITNGVLKMMWNSSSIKFYSSTQELSSYDYNEMNNTGSNAGVSTNINRSQSSDKTKLNINITLTNNFSDTRTVNSLKICKGQQASTSEANSDPIFLFYTYYLTEPVVLSAGQQAFIHLVFDYSQPAPTVTQG